MHNSQLGEFGLFAHVPHSLYVPDTNVSIHFTSAFLANYGYVPARLLALRTLISPERPFELGSRWCLDSGGNWTTQTMGIHRIFHDISTLHSHNLISRADALWPKSSTRSDHFWVHCTRRDSTAGNLSRLLISDLFAKRFDFSPQI